MTALAGRFGGIAVMRPRDGEVLALAGVAYSAPQPPGSTFKIITLAGLLDAGVVKRSDEVPGRDQDDARGRRARERQRRGLRRLAARLLRGVLQLGLRPAGRQARRASGSSPPPRSSASTRSPGSPARRARRSPPRREIGDDLAVGSTAIGQGKVLATPLLMADVAAAIAQGGRRAQADAAQGRRAASPSRATTPETARFIARAMRSVVTDGTGIGAAVPGREGGGQDRHGRAALDRQRGPDPRRPDPAAAGGGPRRTPTPGSPPSRRCRRPAGGGLRAARRSGRGRRHGGAGARRTVIEAALDGDALQAPARRRGRRRRVEVAAVGRVREAELERAVLERRRS